MNKHILIILLFVLGIGAAFYADDILAVFHGMGPLEALEFMLNYVLHVAVVTIVAYTAFGLPKLVQPWLRMLSRKRKAMRRGELPSRAPSKPRMPRWNKDAALAWMAMQWARTQAPKQPVERNDDVNNIRLDF